jgi:sensor histidine kinase YesM
MHLKTKGLLTMSVLEEENELLIKFDDNGIGRKAAGTLEDNSMGKHKSHGMLVTAKRLDYYNKNVTDNIHVIDKQDENGNPTGTCVQVRLQKKYLNTVIKTNNNNDTKAESHHSR